MPSDHPNRTLAGSNRPVSWVVGADVEVITGNCNDCIGLCGWFPQGGVNVSHRGCSRPYRIPNGKNTSKHSKATHVGGELEGVGRGGEASGGEEEGGDLHGWRYDLEKMRGEQGEQQMLALIYATFVTALGGLWDR